MNQILAARTIRALLLGCSALASGVIARPVQAQAPSGAAPSVTAGDIIVTARRTEERLQDVPASLTVYSQADLTKRNIAVATDLATYTPSLSVNQRYGPEKASFSIRGFNQDLSTAPSTGVYFAEVVGVRAQGGTTGGNTVGAGSFTDLANVQVLKGPQGTLFGRNTTGGAILLTPQKPTDNFEGYVEGTYGNFDQKRVAAVLNVPLSDTFRIRAVVERNDRDGYMINRSGVGARDFNDVNYLYGRLSIVGDLTPNLENYLIFHYSHSNTHGYASRMVGCNLNATGLALLQATSCAAQLARQTARGDSLYDVETRIDNPFIRIDTWQTINTTKWQVSDTLTIKNILSYGEYKEFDYFDAGSSNFVVANVNNQGGFRARNISPAFPDIVIPAGTAYDRVVLDVISPGAPAGAESTFIEELQVQGKTADERLNYTIGGYLEFSRPLSWNQSATGIFLRCDRPSNLSCTNPILAGSVGESRTRFNFDNHGIYGQASYKLTDQLTLTGGLRWTFDKIVATDRTTRASLSTAAGSFIDPRTGVSIRRTCADTARFANIARTDPSACDKTIANKSDAPTWMVGMDYKPSPDYLLYAKYSRGYRQGGINFAFIGLETWEPEKLDTYEIGGKASFRGAVSGYFNIAGFYNNLTNQQVAALLVATPEAQARGINAGSSIVNAGKSRSYGVEVDASALFFDSLRLSAGYTYLNTKIVEVATAADLAPKLAGTPWASVTPRVKAGSSFLDSPKHRLSVTGTYTLPLDNSVGDVSIGATWVYTSKYITNALEPQYVNGFPMGITPSSNLVNLNLDWNSVGGSPIDLALFATNVTKEKIKLPNQNSYTVSGVAEVGMSPPRMYGLRLRYRFGQ